MLLLQFVPDLAERLGDPLMRIAGILLAIGALVVIASKFRQIAEIGLPSMLAFASLTLAALVTGHWLGEPDEGQRTSLAVACATRHVGLALLIAAHAKGPNTLPLVANYLFASAFVCIPYVRWRQRIANQSIPLENSQ